MNIVKQGIGAVETIAQKTGILAAFRGQARAECLLCLDSSPAGAVCENCERLLSRPRFACGRCGIALAGKGWCGECVAHPPPFDQVVTAFDYRFPVDRLVSRFKFSADLAIGSYLGNALGRAVARSPRPDLVVASPASPGRLRERGFNPALVLARRVSASLGLPLDVHSLSKSRHTPPQTGLDRAARRRNLRGVFQLLGRLDGLHVAVVDDVLTTGATLAELAGTLKASGARRVSGWVVARTPEPPGRG